MPTKRTKAEQTVQTRRAILDHTRQLFVAQGYAATGTEAMIADLGITRGALYHQFGSKQGVFRAVIEEMFAEISQYVEAEATTVADPWSQLIQGCHAFLDIAQREDIRRLVFIEAPAVLDADTLAKFDQQHGYGLLTQAIQAAVDSGELIATDVAGFTMMINGALDGLAVWVTSGDGSEERLTTAKVLAEELLTRYRQT